MADAAKRPGWYPDPDGIVGQRWWNGASWSDTRRSGDAGATASPAISTLEPSVPVIYSAANPAPQAPGIADSGTPRAAMVINAKLNPLAAYAFVAGLLALFFNVFLIPSVFAVILGIRGLARARQLSAAGEKNNLAMFAVLGLVFGLVGALIGVVQAGLFLVSFVSGF